MLRTVYFLSVRSLLISVMIVMAGCSLHGTSLTHYQVPAEVLKSFRTTHPNVDQVEFSSSMKDGVKLIQASYEEGGEMHSVQYNVHGVVYVPKAEKTPKPEPKQPEEDIEGTEQEATTGDEASKTPPQPSAVVPQKRTP